MDETAEQPLELTLNLSVLDQLGINLYSNVPAVLSEVVANSWDADATAVEVSIDAGKDELVITDNGRGMTREQCRDCYLNVGYQKRLDPDRPESAYGRSPMGRKGIGKLSLFSIAKTVEVHTVSGGERTAFRMNVDEIREAIKEAKGGPGRYKPEPIDPDESLNRGTRLVLRRLKKRLTSATPQHLRTRLARRFGILGAAFDFRVTINNDEVGIADRNYFHKLEYVWWYGKGEERYGENCSQVENDDATSRKHVLLVEEEDGSESEQKLWGWIGTARKPADLKDDEENLNRITIMVRGKLAQEDMLDEFNDGQIYTKYLIGEIHADFLDVDERDDIATASRQKIIEDDPRYRALKKFIRDEMRFVAGRWDDLRDEKGADEAKKIPAIERWYESLEGDEQKQARSLFGKINKISFKTDSDRRQMLQYGVMAFESLRHRKSLSKLDELSPGDIVQLGAVLRERDDLEAMLYHQIVRSRLRVINRLEQLVEQNALEKIVQLHIYENLWLLDPSWERAAGTEVMETAIGKALEKVNLDDEEKRARLDIRYKQVTGTHVIVELKRPGVTLSFEDCARQCRKYLQAVEKVLQQEFGEESPSIEIVVLVGRDLTNWSNARTRERDIRSLKEQHTRVLRYGTLLHNAQKQYGEYLEASKKASRLSKILDEIGEEGFVEEPKIVVTAGSNSSVPA